MLLYTVSWLLCTVCIFGELCSSCCIGNNNNNLKRTIFCICSFFLKPDIKMKIESSFRIFYIVSKYVIMFKFAFLENPKPKGGNFHTWCIFHLFMVTRRLFKMGLSCFMLMLNMNFITISFY